VRSNDWEAITPLHGEMAAMRAVENGAALARAAAGGLSAAYDSSGRTLARNNAFATDDYIMMADLPVQSRRTPYAWIGNALAWASLALLAGLAALALYRRRG
jgi:apolipoprotein N-acyltransferase